MPNFETTPPEDIGRSGYRMVRTPTAAALTGYVLSENLTGCRTHFVGNRTIPCEAPDCDPCASGVPWRWKGYLAAMLNPSNEIVLFEITARAATVFAAYFERYGSTRGAAFKAIRVNQRANGRVLIQAKPADLEKINLPKSPDVQAVLCHIWNIPENQVTTPDHKPRKPFNDTRVDRSRSELVPIDQAIAEAASKELRQTYPIRGGNGEQ